MLGLAFSKSLTVRGRVESHAYTRISVVPFAEEFDELDEPHAATLANIATAPVKATAFPIALNFIVPPPLE